jgi:uncharacterized protein YegL
MRGEPIEAVKDGVQKLLSSLRRDPYALESVYLSLITFSDKTNVLVTLTELSEFYCPEITLSNNAKRNLGLGLQQLLLQYKKEIKRTTTEEKGDWLPITVLMTSGDPSDTNRFETVILQFQNNLFAKKIVCVTGIKNKITVLHHLTHDIFSLDTMNSHTFSKFWQWVSTVATVQSHSISQEEVTLPPPPPEINLFYSETELPNPQVLPTSPPILPPNQKNNSDNSRQSSVKPPQKVQNQNRKIETIGNILNTIIKILPEIKNVLLCCTKYILFSGGIIVLTALIIFRIRSLEMETIFVVFILGTVLILFITKIFHGTKKFLLCSVKKILLFSGIAFVTSLIIVIITMIDAWVNFWFFILGMTLILFVMNIISNSDKIKQIITGCLLVITLFLSLGMVLAGWHSAPDFTHWWYASLGALLSFLVISIVGVVVLVVGNRISKQ